MHCLPACRTASRSTWLRVLVLSGTGLSIIGGLNGLNGTDRTCGRTVATGG